MRWWSVMVCVALMLGGCSGGAEEVVQVTGDTGQCFESNTRWSGAIPPGSGLGGSVLERTIVCPQRTMSDERLSGRVEGSFRCEFVMEGDVAVGDCVKIMETVNDAGTWVETDGSLTLHVENGALADAVDVGVQVGTGDYEGLQFRYETGGTNYPWEITGVLEPVG